MEKEPKLQLFFVLECFLTICKEKTLHLNFCIPLFYIFIMNKPSVEFSIESIIGAAMLVIKHLLRLYLRESISYNFGAR